MTKAVGRGVTLTQDQKLNWLRLIRSDNVGPATFRDLINHFGTASAALEALPDLAKRGGAASRIRICSITAATREMEACHQAGAAFLAIGEPDYSPLLRHYDNAPPLLCVRGTPSIVAEQSFGIVGSRNASITGQKMANRFATAIGQAGYPIVSGLARGIDASAHKSALETGTIAVFGGGVDVIFPEEHKDLADQIVDHGGALVSEMPMGWKPRARDFPRRNRIITGLSLGLLVVEAAKRSGSLITARLANEAGRLVFAVPGSPLDPRSEGTNHLLKQGAILASEADDILSALKPIDPDNPDLFTSHDLEEDEPIYEDSQSPQLDAPQSVREAIINSLGPSPVEVDDILRFSGASFGEVQLVLLELSLAGRLERHGGNRVSLVD